MESIDFNGKRVAVIGFGLEGRSAYKYYTAHGAEVVIVDEADSISNLPENAETMLGSGALDNLSDFDIVSRTPPLRPERIKTTGVVSSVSIEFFKRCPAPIIAVTGTKGKGTTTTLIAKILENAGRKVHLVGNIGTSALDVLDVIEPDDVVCYEISSFQLWDMKASPSVAVVLMVEEDHQDVHTSVEEYVEAKSSIAKYQKSEDTIVVHPTNERSQYIASSSPAKKREYMTDSGANNRGGMVSIDGHEICSVEDVGLIGAHNLENITAAITAAWEYTQDVDSIAKAVKEFKGLANRLEFVAEVEGVKYYNDSFSAAPASAVAAAKAFKEQGVMIFGGKDKGIDYCLIATGVKEASCKYSLLMGDIAPQLANCFKDAGIGAFEVVKGDLSNVVARAKEIAAPGDSVVMSPGSSSFDWFDNYKHRGQVFRDEVEKL